ENIDLKTIGFFSLVGQAYVFKFLWSPLMDRYTPPFFGRRRGWLLATQILLLVAIAAMGFLEPGTQLRWMAALAVVIAFCSASQDIVFDAWKTDVLPAEERGAGAAISVLGYRLGMLVFIGMIGWALLTAMNQPKLGLAMLFGVGFGLLIERAQICFTSAFRDMWITGRTHMAKAIIIGMAVSAIGIFSYVQLGVEPKIMWAGPNAVIGGLLFGFGIVLAGGCETGWMYRAVEGQVHYWWVGLGNVIGSTILAYYWDDFAPALATDWDKINLLKTFGPMGGLLVTYLLLFAALMLIIGWEKRFFRRAAPQIAKEIA
ncbi:MAG: YeeE/YedE thiosulfate transporter family protein, partial [Escherichia coli]|nr:YeeE/YedE thiosulfate transporter family protein [Escherichia coli]